jgi:hypothetical protein
MKIPEHIAFSYLLAQLGVQQQYGPWGTGLMIAAGCLPDLDGLTILGGWRCYRRYHRILGHGLPVTLAGPAVVAGIAVLAGLGPFWPLWLWLQLSLLGHLAVDVCFYGWPVQLLWPLGKRGWGFGLLRWNDLVPTVTLYLSAAVTVIWPSASAISAILGISAVVLYLGWRSLWPQPRTTWGAWLAGDWARHSPRFCRWLTGDFVT